MEKTLTEIGSDSLFHEYLNVAGIAYPVPPKIGQRWEYKEREQLVAKIQIDQQGKARYYIDVRALSVN